MRWQGSNVAHYGISRKHVLMRRRRGRGGRGEVVRGGGVKVVREKKGKNVVFEEPKNY